MMNTPRGTAIPASNGDAGLFDDYAPIARRRDEMVGSSGPRPHWQAFRTALDSLGVTELTRRWEEAQHLIRENGITYNVYGDPRGRNRPWQLDPIPLLIPADDGRVIEVGLIQRARLLDRILADLYGPQRLLQERLVPAELVYANPAFLRPCHGIRLPGQRHIHLYAANLGRTADGSCWCLGERTQAPSGAGYTLENRLVLSRMLPDIFRDCRVQRLAHFFQTFRDSLRVLAPANRDNPRIVLLTPGPYNETYFEHAFLARYLGFTLVEGADLTVRDNRVCLKVLEGLQPVDVIFRRLDDDYCDPLELRPDSFLGVPGLVQAIRAGQVAVANSLGSGLVETPALLPYLPRLCRELLGEELRLPSVPTWWCGEPTALSHVLVNLGKLVIKPTFAAARLEPVFVERLSSEDRQALAARIQARPRNFVAQETMPLATTPVLVGTRLQPRPMVMRAYVTAAGDSFAVMPGGLTRFSAAADTADVSMQSGGGSKDTWVLAAGAVNQLSLLPSRTQPVELSRAGGDLPSRVADNLFWLGRYTERAEGLTRLLRGIFVRLTERSGLTDVPELAALLNALGPRPTTKDDQFEDEPRTVHEVVLALVLDDQRLDSLASALTSVLRVAGMVRDRISVDMWRLDPATTRNGSTVRRVYPPMGEVLDHLDRIVLTLAGFGGLASESMTRGMGWRFLDLGRRLERCLHTGSLLRSTLEHAGASEGPILEAVLEVADSSMTYRRRYLGSLQTAAVLDLLVADETNPRSLVYQLLSLADDVKYLPGKGDQPSPEARVVFDSLANLRLADVEHLERADENGRRSALVEFLTQQVNALPALSDLIMQHYLSHLQVSRHLARASR